MNAPPLRRACAGLFLALAASAAVPDPELEKMEQEFHARRRLILQPLADSYAEKLRSLEEMYVRRGDASAAATVREERARLMESLSPAPQAPLVVPPSEPAAGAAPQVQQLPAGGAELSGGAIPAASGDAVSLPRAGAAVAWRLPAAGKGIYSLSLSHSGGPPQGRRLRLTVGKKAPQLLVLPAAVIQPAQQTHLGDFELEDAEVIVTLEALDPLPASATPAVLRSLTATRLR